MLRQAENTDRIRHSYSFNPFSRLTLLLIWLTTNTAARTSFYYTKDLVLCSEAA